MLRPCTAMSCSRARAVQCRPTSANTSTRKRSGYIAASIGPILRALQGATKKCERTCSRVNRSAHRRSAALAAPRPLPSIDGAHDFLQVHAVVGGIPRWAAAHDHVVAGLQRVPRDPLLIQADGAGPFRADLLYPARIVARLNVHPRVWIAVLELRHVAFDRDELLLDVRRGERMVAAHADISDECNDHQAKHYAWHACVFILIRY